MDKGTASDEARAVAADAGEPQSVSPVPASIPDVWDVAKSAADSLNIKDFEPFIRKVTEDIYERLLFTVEDYLKENSEHNIAERISSAEQRAQRYWETILHMDDAMCCHHGDRLERLAFLVERERLYNELIYQVGNKYEGETRHQTALRYLRERELPTQAMSAGTAEAKRRADMPDEQSAIRQLADAAARLKDFGWGDPLYQPKNGAPLDIIEVGSTGIHRGYYDGEWPNGGWWIVDGDFWPSRPTLARPAIAIDTRSAETEGLSPQGESAGRQASPETDQETPHA